MLITCSLLAMTAFAGAAPDISDYSKAPPNVCTIDVERTGDDILVVLNFEVLVPDDTEETKVPMVRIRRDFYELLLWYYFHCASEDPDIGDDEEDEEDEYIDKAYYYWYPGKLPRGAIRCNL